jgi:hypothetical protein
MRNKKKKRTAFPARRVGRPFAQNVLWLTAQRPVARASASRKSAAGSSRAACKDKGDFRDF